MKRTNESGRSMVEMLGVLAIIGVLSIGGIAGYSMAMNRYRANEALDVANKYAVIVYSGYQTAKATNGSTDNLPTLKAAGLTTNSDATKTPGGVTIATPTVGTITDGTTNPTVDDTGVVLTLVFDNTSVCEAAASIVGKSTACVDKTFTYHFVQS